MNWQAASAIIVAVIALLGFVFFEVENVRRLQQSDARHEAQLDAVSARVDVAVKEVLRLSNETAQMRARMSRIEGHLGVEVSEGVWK